MHSPLSPIGGLVRDFVLADDKILTDSPGAIGTVHGPPVATVLVVEDPYVSAFLRSLLVQRNYEVVFAGFSDARDMLLTGRARIDVLVTNSPLEFTGTPGVPLLYLAANPDLSAIRGFTRALALTKPFHPRELLDCVARLLS